MNSASGGVPHFHVVVSDPNYAGCDDVLVVSFSSIKGRATDDHTVLLYEKDHSWIRLDSYVSYYHAEFISIGFLQKLIQSGEATQQRAVSPPLLERIREGFGVSMDVELRYEKFLKGQNLL